jgi:hypothetical protein
MDRQLANFLFEEARKTFAFLGEEYSFAPPRLEINDKINFAFVTFMGKNLAVECILGPRWTIQSSGAARRKRAVDRAGWRARIPRANKNQACRLCSNAEKARPGYFGRLSDGVSLNCNTTLLTELTQL